MAKNKGDRFNVGKPGTQYLQAAALIEVAKVAEFGAQKYGVDNYRKGLNWSTYVGSLLRHTFQWYTGEEIDHESGLHHLAHAAWNALAALDALMYGHGTDDRFEAREFSKLWLSLRKDDG